MKGLYTIMLLLVSNIFMTLAWYGQLKFKFIQGDGASRPLFWIILISWGIAFCEYCCLVPANRIGYIGTGGPFSLLQLKIMQEVITLLVFVVFSTLFFKSEPLRLNHLFGAICLILAVYFIFKK